jgi:hypothetical protein
MRSFPIFGLFVAALSALSASAGQAGVNAGATARLYWMSAASSSGTPLTARNSVASTAAALVTVRGVTSVRGVELQIIVAALDRTGLPGCWQYASFFSRQGGWRTATSSVLPPLLSANNVADGDTAVRSVIPFKEGSTIDYHDPAHPQWTPNNCGLIWYQAFAPISYGRIRNPSKEYAVIGFGITPDTDPMEEPWCLPVCINPNLRIGYGDHDNVTAILIGDANKSLDLCPFENGYRNLVYGDASLYAGCPEVTTPATAATWGSVRRLYR